MSRRGTAPCGHPGTFATNSLITCDKRCEFAPKVVTSPPWPTHSEDDFSGLILEGDEDLSDGVPLAFEDIDTAPLCSNCLSSDVSIYPGMYANGRSLWFCNSCSTSFPGRP